MTLLEQSRALHERVRAFADRRGDDDFEHLALAIARYQARHAPGFARLVRASKSGLRGLEEIPPVPTAAFREARVAVHPSDLDAAVFLSSGTTDVARSAHPFRTLDTYRTLSLIQARAALLPHAERATVVALLPPPTDPPSSSLGYMATLFMQGLDGRCLDGETDPGNGPGRFLINAGGVDLEGLERAAAMAKERREALLLIAPSFSLVALLEALRHRTLELPPESVLVQTGGYKGRTREVEPAELNREVARALRIERERIVSEYGMTELSSQLFEGSLPGARPAGPPGVYLEPPWLRVEALDPVSLERLAPGQAGLGLFIDLGNVDSAVAVVTQDRIQRAGAGIRLLGRQPGAPPRGCSLSVEALLEGARDG